MPRTTPRWKEIYRKRRCVEPGFGLLKHEWGIFPLRVRRTKRVWLHIDVMILVELASALSNAGELALAA